jgi:all-trans-retinol 13,14-reductase
MFVPIEPFETTILGAPSSKYEKVYDLEAYKKYLVEKFPAEENSIKKYFEIVKEAANAYEKSYFIKSLPLPVAKVLTWTGLHHLLDAGYSKWASTTVQEVLEGLTDNKELQAVLAANYVDVGTDPSHAPFIIHAVIANAYAGGAYYPHGGPSNISNKIVKTITANGGKVFICAKVKRILVDENSKQVKGVEMHDGSEIKSKRVVSDVGLINTATHLLPSGLIDVDFDEGGSRSDSKLHPSGTCLSLFVGLQEDPETLNLPSGVSIIHPSNELVANYEKLQKMSLKDALKGDTVKETMEGEFNHLGPIFVSFPSKNDKAWETDFPGKTTIEILAFVPWKWFEPYESQWNSETKSHGEEYETLKLRLADKTWQRVVEVFEQTCPTLPKGLESIDHYIIGTPLTYSHFLGSDHGALYGLDHDMKRFEPKMQYLRLRPKVPEVPGLYLSGQDVAVCGFSGAMLGGLLCAGNILNVDDPFTLIRNQET